MKRVNFLAVIGIFFLSACSGSGEKNKLTVGVHSWPGGGMIYVGDEMGFFAAEGIDLDIKKIENFDTKRSSLIAGNIDIDVANTLDQLLIYNESNFAAEIIGITDESVGGDGLVVQNDIKTFSDLKGKTIAYAEASPSDFYLRYILQKNNIDISEIKLKPVADPQIAGNSIIAKQVDAAVTYEPFLSQADAVDGISILSSTKDYPTLIPGLLIASSDKVKSEKELYKAFLRGWFKSVDYYNSNRTESEMMIAKGMGMALIEVQEILSVVNIQTKANNVKLINKSTKNNLYELVESIAVFWKSSGFIKQSIDPENLINNELISQ